MTPITVITGEFSGRRVERLERLGWGRCYVNRRVYFYEGEPWIFDNAAYGAWNKAGKPIGLDESAWSELWSESSYVDKLDEAFDRGRPTIAVVPDIPGSAASLAFSKTWLEAGPGSDRSLVYDWPWYLAVQDGFELEAVRELVVANNADPRNTPIAGLFLGGSDDFKDETGADWAALAHELGLKAHYGRCGSVKRLRAAVGAGFDSCDSALILWTEAKFNRQAKAWLELTGQDVTEPDLYAWVLEGCPLDERWREAHKAESLEANGDSWQPTRFVPPGYTYRGRRYNAGATQAWAAESGQAAAVEVLEVDDQDVIEDDVELTPPGTFTRDDWAPCWRQSDTTDTTDTNLEEETEAGQATVGAAGQSGPGALLASAARAA